MELFEDRERCNSRPKAAAESTYQFLERVHDPAFARVRGVLNQWTECFGALQSPDASRDLAGRLRSKQDQQFDAAFWELYLHELHVRLGYEVTVHPESTRSTRPDFWIANDREEFYLEAVAPPSEPETSRSVETMLEYVDQAYHPDFWLKLRFVVPAEQVPRKREVIRKVQNWLRTLDWKAWWRGRLDPTVAYPEAVIRVRGWHIGLQALPRAPEARSRRRRVRMIGIRSGPVRVLGSGAEGIQATLDAKANRYGDLDAPFVVAIWIGSRYTSPGALGEALFGFETPSDLGAHATHLPSHVERDGIWTPNRQRRGRISAVLSATRWSFSAVAVARVMPHLWLNPWASHPLDTPLPFAVSRLSTDEAVMENTPPRTTPTDLFDLPSDWPGELFKRAYRARAAPSA